MVSGCDADAGPAGAERSGDFFRRSLQDGLQVYRAANFAGYLEQLALADDLLAYLVDQADIGDYAAQVVAQRAQDFLVIFVKRVGLPAFQVKHADDRVAEQD